MKVDVYGINGKSTGRSVDLPDDIFGIEPNEHAIYLDVKAIQAHKRQGTHKAKERGEIKGSMRKIKKQKGTGTARAGSMKNPLYRSGGRIFGPRPRSYDLKVNKKVKRIARVSAIASMVKSGAFKIVEDFTFEAPKTKEFANVMKNLECTKGALMVLPQADAVLQKSCQNIKKIGVVTANNLNTLDILKAGTLILSEGSVSKIVEALKK